MIQPELLTGVTQDELNRCLELQPEFRGNREHLVMFYRVLNTRRSSDQRRDALAAWASYNTYRTDSIPGGKGPYKESYRGIDLRGLKLDQVIVGPMDLREADLRGVEFNQVALTKANFTNADLRGADLQNCFLRGANLSCAKLQGVNLAHAFLGDANLSRVECDEHTNFEEADLQGANLSMANLQGSSLKQANLQLAQLVETDLRGADLSGCKVFGIAAWSPRINTDTRQQNLLVTPEPTEPAHRGRRQNSVEITGPVQALTTESLEHAHLMYLMMNPDLSDLLESVTSKGVLLLGRFSGKQGEVLDALRAALRAKGFLPLKFDFRKSDSRTLKETVLTLAGLSRFIIADITEASSVPLELTTIVKDYKIPIVPIQRQGRRTFSMFESIDQEYRDRVLPSLEYEDIDDLVLVLEKGIIDPALERAAELVRAKSFMTALRKTRDYMTKENKDRT